MKPEFYDRSKRANVYNSIYMYKVISLACLLVLSIILIVLFLRDRAYYAEISGTHTPTFLIVVAVSIALFIVSIIIDFYILSSTASIGHRLSKLAYIDHLTGLPNRYSCDLLINSFNDPERLPGAGFVLMELSNLGSINKDTGHEGGNWLITEFSSILEDISENYGYAGRNSGNEFILLMENCDSTQVDMFLLDLTRRIRGYNEMNVGSPMEVCYSKVLNCEEHKESISELISLGYKKIREMPQKLS
jgi:diguanylate cyclase (GGDEF)-like protein